MGNLFTSARKEAREMSSTLKDAASSVRDTFRDGSIKRVPRRINEPGGIDPVKIRKFIVTVIKLLIVFEFIAAIIEGAATMEWGRLGRDLVLAGVVYIMWERIKKFVLSKKDVYRRRMEKSGGEMKLWDALVFSLLWSDEIYSDIPLDQRRLVVISYTLIAIGLGALFLSKDRDLFNLILSGSLVLGAVNLLAWIVSRERGEKESLRTELKLAHDVQISLMPKEHPKVPGFDIAGISIPAKEVGGDHFDYAFPCGDSSRFCVSVFDVSGKGMQAAMSAVFTSGAFASEVQQNSSVADILTRLNKAIYSHSKRGHFVAFLLATIDVHDRDLTFANAGQLKPLLKSNDTLQWLDSNGVHFPLGMKQDSAYDERTIRFNSGDMLLLFTDGFTEAMNSTREQFGVERIEQIVQRVEAGRSSHEVLNDITREVQRFAGDTAQHDDMTMVVIRVL